MIMLNTIGRGLKNNFKIYTQKVWLLQNMVLYLGIVNF